MLQNRWGKRKTCVAYMRDSSKRGESRKVRIKQQKDSNTQKGVQEMLPEENLPSKDQGQRMPTWRGENVQVNQIAKKISKKISHSTNTCKRRD